MKVRKLKMKLNKQDDVSDYNENLSYILFFRAVLNQYAAVINLPCAQRATRKNFVHHVAAALKLKLKLKLASFINVKYNFFTYFVRRRWHDNGSTFPPRQKNTMQNIIN